MRPSVTANWKQLVEGVMVSRSVAVRPTDWARERCAGLLVIDYMSDRKLVSRRPNPFDRRSALLAIGEIGLSHMAALIERSVARVSANPPQECSTCLI